MCVEMLYDKSFGIYKLIPGDVLRDAHDHERAGRRRHRRLHPGLHAHEGPCPNYLMTYKTDKAVLKVTIDKMWLLISFIKKYLSLRALPL